MHKLHSTANAMIKIIILHQNWPVCDRLNQSIQSSYELLLPMSIFPEIQVGGSDVFPRIMMQLQILFASPPLILKLVSATDLDFT